jgi:hypothetical protein
MRLTIHPPLSVFLKLFSACERNTMKIAVKSSRILMSKLGAMKNLKNFVSLSGTYNTGFFIAYI